MGFDVRVDWSWLIIAVFITWSLAAGLFPYYFRNFPPSTYWWMGIAGTIGLFASIVLHEFGHSIVARRFGIPMQGITLFIFGGVASMADEPPTPQSEFFMAIAGPITSVILAVIFYLLARLGDAVLWPVTVIGVFKYLAWINIVLVAFNMIPAFPLDGGRVLRSILWGIKKNFRWATRVASVLGSAFGIVLILLGVVNFVFGSFITGVWWFILGLFLRRASQSSYQQVLLRQALQGEHVQQFMTANPVAVSPGTSVKDVVEQYVYPYHFKMLPVVQDGNLLGCVTVDRIKDLPREGWNQHTAGELAAPSTPENTVAPEDDAIKALSAMNRAQTGRLMVADHGHLVGMIALKDLMKFLSLKMELEGA
jgi:Zn-dependent protease/CBS domain-containing protein